MPRDKPDEPSSRSDTSLSDLLRELRKLHRVGLARESYTCSLPGHTIFEQATGGCLGTISAGIAAATNLFRNGLHYRGKKGQELKLCLKKPAAIQKDHPDFWERVAQLKVQESKANLKYLLSTKDHQQQQQQQQQQPRRVL